MQLRDILQREARREPRQDTAVPRSFAGFVEYLGVRLTEGQKVLTDALFDGGAPAGDIAEQMFGGTDLTKARRDVVVVVAGARGGKTRIAIATRMLHQMLVADLSTMAPGQRAVALVIAPNEKLRQEAVRYARGAVGTRRELESMVVDDHANGFSLRRQDGHVVSFEAGTANAGGYGGRGRSLVCFATDEVAFFRGADHKVNDSEIFRAGSARVLPGCQSIVASTPWAKAGLLYDMWRDNWGQREPATALVAWAPTLLVHDSEMTRAVVAREMSRDPESAAREFGAQFLSIGTDVFFSEDTINACLVDGG